MLIVGIALLSGCLSQKKLDNPSLKAFRKQVSKAIPGITSIRTVAQPTHIVFRYSFKKEPDIKVQMDIVKRTDDIIRTEPFKTELFESYFKLYFKEERYTPNITIPMDTDGDGVANLEYFTVLGKDGDWSWYYSDYKNMAKEVALP